MRRLAVLLGVIWLAGGAASAQPVGSPAGGLRLVPGVSSERPTLITAGGRQELALPAGFHPAHLLELAAGSDGWLLAGQVPEGDGHRLHLVRGGTGGTATLPEPPGQIGRHRIGPAPLVAAGRLAGLAWLEGDDSRTLAVRVARWSGSEWTPGPWVSTPGAGTQIALAATVLADGRWLLVWSGWDGEDDEILWSVGDGELFSPAAPLHAENRVPDITPALAAAGGGALAAWSRYDGNDYRLRLARFDGREWAELDWSGGRGSLEAGFLEHAGAPYLLYRTVAGDSWDLVELTPAGTVRRRAAAPASPLARPFVELAGPRPVFTWPLGGERAEPEWRRP